MGRDNREIERTITSRNIMKLYLPENFEYLLDPSIPMYAAIIVIIAKSIPYYLFKFPIIINYTQTKLDANIPIY